MTAPIRYRRSNNTLHIGTSRTKIVWDFSYKLGYVAIKDNRVLHFGNWD